MKKHAPWIVAIGLLVAVNIAAKVKFAYRLEKGKTCKYAYQSETRTNQEMMGRPVVSSTKSDIVIVLEPVGTAENGDLSCNAWFDRMVIRVSSSRLDSTFNLAAYANKRARLVLAPYGKVKSVVPVDSMPPPDPMLQMLGIDARGLFRRVLVTLPQAELGENETWVNSVPDTSQMSNMEVITTPKVEYRISGRETVSGFDCVKVGYTGPVRTAGKGSRMGADFTFEGEGTLEGTLYYAGQNGLLISGENRSEQQSSIVITGAANMTIVQNTNTVTKITYVP